MLNMIFAWVLVIQILFFSFCFFFPPIHGSLQSTDTKHDKGLHLMSRISLPPSPAPEAVSPSYNPTTIFNVRSYGAIGDGVTDDTQAFKLAWDTACQTEDSEVLVPKGHSFMIQSTIFTGPCKPGLKMQVI